MVQSYNCDQSFDFYLHLILQLLSVLKELNDDELVEPMTNVFKTIVFISDRLSCLREILNILKMVDQHVVVYKTALKVMGHTAEKLNYPDEFILTSDFLDEFSKVFDYILRVKPNNSNSAKGVNELKCITLLSFKEFINSLNASHQNQKDTQINGFIRDLCMKAIQYNILGSSEESVCISCIDFLNSMVAIDKKNIKLGDEHERKNLTDFWENRLESDLCIQLQIISSDIMKMKMASKAVENFLRNLDEIKQSK